MYLLICHLGSKEIKPVNLKGNKSWICIGKTDAEAEILKLWPTDEKNWLTGKDPDAGKDEGGRRRGWDSWMASLIQWAWVWASFGSWWWTRKPGVLQSKGLQRVGRNWATELNWLNKCSLSKLLEMSNCPVIVLFTSVPSRFESSCSICGLF